MTFTAGQLALGLLVLAASAGAAGSQPAAEPGKANEVEVRFANGSTVRTLVLQDALEVVTKYGKLTVPTSEIRRIEFGVHVTEETARKIREAIKRLGSKAFPEREAAAKELIALGRQAFPALHEATQSADPEVVQRARDAIKQIRARVPESMLRTKVNDRVHTEEFSVVGRVTTATIKAKTPYFGDNDLHIADLVSLRSLSISGNLDVTIDAAKYGSAPGQWLDTGVELNADMPLRITASGQVDLWVDGTGQYVTGPGGQRGQGPFFGPGGRGGNALPGGALVGRIGENGETFVIGERYQGNSPRDGKLFLHITPSPWGNASVGSYAVKIVAGDSR